MGLIKTNIANTLQPSP